MARLIVDDRYRPGHGIGRYAAEVLPRLELDWVPLGGRGRPTTVQDTLHLRRLRLNRHDLLYSPGFGTGPARCRQLLTLHDLSHLRAAQWGERSALFEVYYERVVRPVVTRMGHVVTISETSASDLRRWLSDDRVTVHNCGIGCSTAFTSEGARHEGTRPYFLYVGNLKPHKNPDVVFAALAQIPEAALIVVTDDVAAGRRLAGAHGIESRVEFRSRQSDEELASLYRGAISLVFPSIWEGFGLPVLEALICGSRVVYASACTSVVEICDGTQFAVDDAHSPSEVAAAMDAAWRATNPPVPELSRYTWDSVASAVSQLLASVGAGAAPN